MPIENPRDASSAKLANVELMRLKRAIERLFSEKSMAKNTTWSQVLRESEDGMMDLSLLLESLLVSRDDEEVNEVSIEVMVDLLRTSRVVKVSKDGKRVGPRPASAQEECTSDVLSGGVIDNEELLRIKGVIESLFTADCFARSPNWYRVIQESEDGMTDLMGVLSVFKPFGTHCKAGKNSIPAMVDLLRTSEVLKVSEDGKRIGPRAASAQLEVVKPEEAHASGDGLGDGIC